MTSKFAVFKAAENKEESEPALKVGAGTGTVAGALAVLAYLFPDLLSDKQFTIILVVAAFVLPIITAVLTRGKVWSIASVKEVIDEAVAEAEKTAFGIRGPKPDKPTFPPKVI